MSTKPKRRKNLLTDTVEALTDAGKQIGKDTARGVISVVDLNSFLYGPTPPEHKPEELHKKSEKLIKEYGVDAKTRKENEKMVANHTPIDVQALRDKQQIEDIKKRLFNYQEKESERARRKADEEKERRMQAEEEEKQKKMQESEAAHQAPAEEVQGKDKPRLGAPRKKASTDSHQNFEQKANKGK
jgi:hypothetical protein